MQIIRSENNKYRSIKLIKGDSKACQKDDKVEDRSRKVWDVHHTIVWDNICDGMVIYNLKGNATSFDSEIHWNYWLENRKVDWGNYDRMCGTAREERMTEKVQELIN